MKIIFTLLSAFMFFASLSYAGPFGTTMGDSPDKYTDLKNTKTNQFGIERYLTSKMPKMHSSFENYLLDFGNAGLVSVVAVSEIFDNDRAGIRIRNSYDTLKKQLSEKYGSPLVLEMLSPNSIWKKENEFINSIVHNERVHGCQWEKNLPDNLKEIKLMIYGESHDRARILLSYKYINIDEVNKMQEKNEKDSL